jgi:chromate transporter
MLFFFKIGLFCFGGGYPMLSMVKEEFVEKLKWLTHDDFLHLVSFTQILPGPIPIKLAAYIGKKKHSFLIGFLASIMVSLPSFFLILIVAYIFHSQFSNPYVMKVLLGIRVAIVVIIFDVVLKLFKSTKSFLSVLIIIASLYALIFTSFSPIDIIALGGVLGLLGASFKYFLVRKKRGPHA